MSHTILSRRQLIKALLGLGTVIVSNPQTVLRADGAPQAMDDFAAPLIHAPEDPQQWSAWRMRLKEWRKRTRGALRYDDRRYQEPAQVWVMSSFSSSFLMLYDQTFFDQGRGQYQVETFLQQAKEDFGGFDNLILWHAYPRIGADDRNQFDFYRDMPGGLNGLREVVGRCHRLGVKALIVYKPWDIGTRREPVSDVESLATLVRAIGADGVYLDTMPEAPDRLRTVLDDIGPGLVIEGEGVLPLEHVHDHHMSWAQYFEDSRAPGVLKNKWFERRHMMHQTARWRRDRSEQLHTAWMNGSGIVVWEIVFGSWVGWSDRDRSMLRTMRPIQRRFAALFSGEGWTPLVQTHVAEVYATLWEGPGIRLWTLVNRADKPISGLLLKVPAMTGVNYYDVFSGQQLSPRVYEGTAFLSGALASRGIGGFVAGTPASVGSDFSQFLATQRELHFSEIGSTEFPRRPVALLSQAANNLSQAHADFPEMIKIPSASFTMRVQLRTRECGFYENEMDHDELYENFHKPRTFERTIALPAFAIDAAPVTNAQYAEFLLAADYQPRYPENFLKHWADGNPPVGKEDHPVVYVGLEDARAYAQWAGKAIPSEEQWQYAAQGPAALKYPWGNVMEPGRCNGGETGGTTSVTAFPSGRSPFGCYDMCGNVWEWTESERTDGRTRFCMIRGGSYYTAQGSHWYMDGGPQPADFAAKFLLMWPGLDRCATIGFRCVASVEIP